MKGALVTGIGGGVGCSLGIELCRQGWSVFGICQKIHPRVDALRKEIAANGGSLEIQVCDFTDTQAVEKLNPWLEKIAPSLDAFVHLAAPRLTLEPIWRTTAVSFDAQWQVGARAAFQMAHSILRPMSKKEKAHWIFVLSEVTLGNPPKGMCGYVAGKYALLGLAQAIAAEYAPRIRVACLSPSIMDTELLGDLPETAKQLLVKATEGRGFMPIETLVREILSALETDDAASPMNRPVVSMSK